MRRGRWRQAGQGRSGAWSALGLTDGIEAAAAVADLQAAEIDDAVLVGHAEVGPPAEGHHRGPGQALDRPARPGEDLDVAHAPDLRAVTCRGDRLLGYPGGGPGRNGAGA